MLTLGIDFGTTKTIAAYWKTGMKSPVPTRVLLGTGRDDIPTSIHVDAEGEFSFGNQADKMRFHDPAGYISRIKRDLGSQTPCFRHGKQYLTVDLISYFLEYVIKRSQDEALHGPIQYLVVTVPAAYGHKKRKELKFAIEKTGVSKFDLMDEPVAAALAWLKLKGDLGNAVMVFDWGGGTLDVAVLEKGQDYRPNPELVDGYGDLGGEDIDEDLISGIDRKLKKAGYAMYNDRSVHDQVNIKDVVRDAKIQLAYNESVNLSFALSDLESAKWPFTRTEFNRWIATKVDKAVELAKRQYEKSRTLGVIIDQVILIGGSSRIPLVSELLEKELGISPLKWDQSIEAVAYGAAIHAAKLGDISTPKPKPFYDPHQKLF